MVVLIISFSICLFSKEYINFGKFKDDESIFKENDINKLTKKFLGTKYVSNTLANKDINTSKENLIINFEALDCFTFIDTIEALKTSKDKQEFKRKLINTRYKDGKISYKTRNHFFSDWVYFNSIKDITCNVGDCQSELKYLNKNFKYLKQIKQIDRKINYIKPYDIKIEKIKSGDYIGICTNKKDLDVTHTGILIKKDGKLFIRHASSLVKEIIDSDFFEYVKNRSGVVIYRSTEYKN